MNPRAAAFALLACLAAPAHADVQQAAPDSFFITFVEPVSVVPAKAYAGVLAMPRWWSGEHTWSGSAANLSLNAEAGGCFCERWPGGSAEHGRVIMALPDKLLRLDAALGPLQEFALKGVLSFWIRSNDDGATEVAVEYRVDGAANSGLDQLAPQVDEMLAAQVVRLKRYIETGNAELPVAPPADAAALVPAVPGAKVAPAKVTPAKTRAAKAKPATPTGNP